MASLASWFRWFVGGSKTTRTHTDNSRAAVGFTAYLVSGIRALRSKSNSGTGKALINDHVAVRLFDLWSGSAPLKTRILIALFGTWIGRFLLWMKPRLRHLMALVVVRTKVLDRYIEEAVTDQGIEQMVVFGSGLDARVFRMPVLQNISTFEVLKSLPR